MSKRKPPKNLRPYATPSGKKARMVEVVDDELAALLLGTVGTPHVVIQPNAKCYCNADELRKWRASQTTSGDANGTE